MGKSSSVTFSLTFYRGGRPNFEKGDKYCPRCELVHPIEYAPAWCVLCNSPLVFNPRKTSAPEELRHWRQAMKEDGDADPDELLPPDDGEWGATGVVMIFRFNGRPAEGERYCSECKLVHPAEYFGRQCVRCRNPLQRPRVKDEPWTRAVDADLDGERTPNS
jgi:uncharacterized protein YbaR (Trm112 family)